MGLYIKGMEMPKSCLSCPLQGGTADCRLTQKTYNWGLSERPSDCPLFPVPPHGRLGDLDVLVEKAWDADTRCSYVQVVDVGDILDAPTIIPAEEE